MLTLVQLYECLLLAVAAWTYSVLLTEPEMIFNWIYVYAERYFPNWLYKPFIGCSLCVSGQLALWTYIILYYDNYAPISHLTYITTTIFTTYLITKWQNN